MFPKFISEPINIDKSKIDEEKMIKVWNEAAEEIHMGRCVVCKTKKPVQKYNWKSDDGKRWLSRYVCDECFDKKITKDKEEYKIKYDKALKYFKDNNYYVLVHNNGKTNKDEKFSIGDDIMECVSIIRKRMEDQGYFEDWIDIDWETYDDCEITVVKYLSYIILSKDKRDKYGDLKVEKSIEFWIYITNDDNLHIQ